ncbi:hypothetical protein CR513_37974, partial [Mucuna pruriens]
MGLAGPGGSRIGSGLGWLASTQPLKLSVVDRELVLFRLRACFILGIGRPCALVGLADVFFSKLSFSSTLISFSKNPSSLQPSSLPFREISHLPLPAFAILHCLAHVYVVSEFFLQHPFISFMVKRGGSHSDRSSNSSSPGGSTVQGNDETQQSTSSVAEVEFPFTILFREAPESDSEGGELLSWIDPGVMEVHSVYTRPESLVGMADAICSRGVSASLSAERGRVRVGQREGGALFLLLRDHVLKVGHQALLLCLRVNNLAGLQLSYTRTVGPLFEPLNFYVRTCGGSPPSSIFPLHRADKVGWTFLSNRPRWKLMKPFQESYKQFKNHFF